MNTNGKQQVELWSKLISSTSSEGILHTAMRHTAHSLADMVERPIKVNSLRVETLPINRLGAYTDDPETETVGIYLLIGEDLLGEAILVLSLADAMYLADWLLQARPGTTTRLGTLECSALAEAGNLVLSSFLNAVADFTGMPLRISPPAVMVDMLATVFETVAISAGKASDELLVIEADFMNVESDLSIQFWVLPDPAVLTVEDE